MSHILQKDNPLLRERSFEIPIDQIKSARIQGLIKKMKEILAKEEDGVALAAPQIGESVRLFVVSGRLLWFIENPKKEKEPKEFPSDLIFINPKIIKLSKEKKWVDEGCLSVRYLYGKIKRSTKATITAYDEKGKKIQRGASGVLAQVFQHEVDHLNGKLFIDEAKDLEVLPPEKIKK